MKNDITKSGLAFGWIEETRPRRWSPWPYVIASAMLVAMAAGAAAGMAWWFR